MYSTCTTITRKNRDGKKPNEDSLSVAPQYGIFAIADGITRGKRPDGSYPVPSTAAHAAQIFTAEAIRALPRHVQLHSLEVQQLIRGTYAEANTCIGEYAALQPPVNWYDNDYPATVATVLVIHDDSAVWGHLGDSLLLLLKTDGTVSVLSRNQTEGFSRWAKTQYSENWDDYDRWIYSRRDLRNHPEEPGAYGALTGEPQALSFVETGICKVEIYETLALLTDGFSSLWVDENIPFTERSRVPKQVHDYLRTGDLESLVEAAEAAEDRHSLRSDDKTAVLVSFHESKQGERP